MSKSNILDKPVNKFKIKLLNELLEILVQKFEFKNIRKEKYEPTGYFPEVIKVSITAPCGNIVFFKVNIFEDDNFKIYIKTVGQSQLSNYLMLSDKNITKYNWLLKPTVKYFVTTDSTVDLKDLISFLKETEIQKKAEKINW